MMLRSLAVATTLLAAVMGQTTRESSSTLTSTSASASTSTSPSTTKSSTASAAAATYTMKVGWKDETLDHSFDPPYISNAKVGSVIRKWACSTLYTEFNLEPNGV